MQHKRMKPKGLILRMRGQEDKQAIYEETEAHSASILKPNLFVITFVVSDSARFLKKRAVFLRPPGLKQ
jgi:hypothetical protein